MKRLELHVPERVCVCLTINFRKGLNSLDGSIEAYFGMFLICRSPS